MQDDNSNKHKMYWYLLGAFATFGLATYLYASNVESRRYKLESQRVYTGNKIKSFGSCISSCRNMEEFESVAKENDLKRLRILHLSDLHLCKPETHKIDFLRRVTDSNYDLIVITGDVFEDYSGIEYADKIITRKARLGNFAVLGNHDYYDYTLLHRTVGRFYRKLRTPKTKRDVRPLVQALKNADISVLQNDLYKIPGEKIGILGIDYPDISDLELSNLLAKNKEEFDLMLALVHVPNGLLRLENIGVDLVMAGHTHGGQLRLPGFGPLITNSELPRHEASGLFWRGDTAIHVSRGLGASPHSNFRLFCPPHASVLEICHKK